MDDPIDVPNDTVEQAQDIDNMGNGGSDVVDVLDELEMPEGGDDAIDLDEINGDHFDIEEGIDGDSSFLHDHLSAHATTENVTGHKPTSANLEGSIEVIEIISILK